MGVDDDVTAKLVCSRLLLTPTTKLTMMRLVSLFLLFSTVLAVKETRTGIDFPEKYKGSHLSKLGVRTKGPIKVRAEIGWSARRAKAWLITHTFLAVRLCQRCMLLVNMIKHSS